MNFIYFKRDSFLSRIFNRYVVFFSQLKRQENSYRLYTGQQEKNDYELRKNDIKRITISCPYKPLNEKEFLTRTPIEIRQEFRKIPNPPAKDPYAAK